MACGFGLQLRRFSTSSTFNGKKNFRKFPLFSRGPEEWKNEQAKNPLRELPLGVRLPGFLNEENEVELVPEQIPELIVPDLKDFNLKPYVSYRAADVVQSEFTAQDLFNACYADKMLADFKNGKLDENGNSLEPNENEKQTAEEAWIKARQTGSDIYCRKPVFKEKLEPFM